MQGSSEIFHACPARNRRANEIHVSSTVGVWRAHRASGLWNYIRNKMEARADCLSRSMYLHVHLDTSIIRDLVYRSSRQENSA